MTAGREEEEVNNNFSTPCYSKRAMKEDLLRDSPSFSRGNNLCLAKYLSLFCLPTLRRALDKNLSLFNKYYSSLEDFSLYLESYISILEEDKEYPPWGEEFLSLLKWVDTFLLSASLSKEEWILMTLRALLETSRGFKIKGFLPDD